MEITTVQKLEVEDGDVLAVFVKGYVPEPTREKAKAHLQEAFLPKRVKVVIFNDEVICDLKVVRAK